MTTAQIIEAINVTARQEMFRDFESPEAKARDTVYAILRRTAPCACCDGSGFDMTKPFDISVLVTEMGGQKCDCCDGRGFQIDGNDDSVIYDWVAQQ